MDEKIHLFFYQEEKKKDKKYYIYQKLEVTNKVNLMQSAKLEQNITWDGINLLEIWPLPRTYELILLCNLQLPNEKHYQLLSMHFHYIYISS